MHDRERGEATKRQIRYGAVAAVVVILAAGLIFLTHHVDPTTASAPATDATPGSATAGDARRAAAGAATSPATAPPVAAASNTAVQATSGDDVAVVSGLRRDEAVALIGDARRKAAAGDYAEAEAALGKAEKAVPNLPETRQARVDIARLQTPEGQLSNHIQRARLAVDHDDSAAAEAALLEAARLKADAPEIAELRTALKAAHDKKAQREARIADALARMRAAMARRDFAAADGALNEAERIDVQEPTIRRARNELAHARSDQQKPSE